MSNVVMLLSFLLFLGFFAAVGLSSMRVKEDTTDDYLVAGRGMHPALAALSAVSTWNSGYMFIGFIGFTYAVGYSAIWIGLASTVGQVIAWIWLYKYIQRSPLVVFGPCRLWSRASPARRRQNSPPSSPWSSSPCMLRLN